jgi:hypothetical protein
MDIVFKLWGETEKPDFGLNPDSFKVGLLMKIAYQYVHKDGQTHWVVDTDDLSQQIGKGKAKSELMRMANAGLLVKLTPYVFSLGLGTITEIKLHISNCNDSKGGDFASDPTIEPMHECLDALFSDFDFHFRKLGNEELIKAVYDKISDLIQNVYHRGFTPDDFFLLLVLHDAVEAKFLKACSNQHPVSKFGQKDIRTLRH